MNKKLSGRHRILLCWGYHRAGWITAFEKLKSDYDFTYLYYRRRAEEAEVKTDCHRIFWDEFASGKEIIEALQPRCVVMMSIDSGLAIALNAACKAKGIPTYVLQHGLTRSLEEYSNSKQIRDTSSQHPRSDTFKTLLFILRSIAISQAHYLPSLARYLWKLRTSPTVWVALRDGGFALTKPKLYICFNRRNAQIFREIDTSSDERTIFIGIPEFDDLFQKIGDQHDQRYFLLIDQPWAENPYRETTVTRAQMINLYRSLNSYALSKGHGLTVKLHPDTYRADWLPSDPNITWERDCNLPNLMAGASGIFGGNSTLILAALYLKPCFLIDGTGSSLINDVLRRGLAKGCTLEDFNTSKIEFSSPNRNSAEFVNFVDMHLGPVDGGAVARLQEILSQQP